MANEFENITKDTYNIEDIIGDSIYKLQIEKSKVTGTVMITLKHASSDLIKRSQSFRITEDQAIKLKNWL